MRSRPRRPRKLKGKSIMDNLETLAHNEIKLGNNLVGDIDEGKHLIKMVKIHCHLRYGYFALVNQFVITNI